MPRFYRNPYTQDEWLGLTSTVTITLCEQSERDYARNLLNSPATSEIKSRSLHDSLPNWQPRFYRNLYTQDEWLGLTSTVTITLCEQSERDYARNPLNTHEPCKFKWRALY